ncbi:MAG: hypothetical protein ACD_76C00106G0007 [uncultured bacterium]|nr:MAG: hypothetical protein ACD_76C00106G0007 [uncultured bacterium]HBD05592.1 hypothetical protein [Candidatus Uhrbacteria bacterium]
MREQFFSKTFWITLSLLAAWFAIAVLSFFTNTATIATSALAIATFIISLRKTEYGIYIAFAELFTGSHGHVLPYARMAIFAAIMLAWLIKIIFKKTRIPQNLNLYMPFFLLATAVALGFAIGLLRNNAKDAFDDANGFFYLVYLLPIISVKWDAIKQHNLLQILAASAVWISILTLILIYIFSHMSEPIMRSAYTFARDTRIGEFTHIGAGVYRIFIQSQFTSIAFLFIITLFFLYNSKITDKAKEYLAPFSLIISSLIASMSRSFAIGLSAGIIAFFAFCWQQGSVFGENFTKKISIIFLSLVASFLLLFAAVSVPVPPGTGSFGLIRALSTRTDSGDLAISSRWKLLPRMNDAIFENPIFGSGFGTIVAFPTDDPRILSISPDGMWRTYRFEWGWHDLWLKMGIFGPIAMLYLIFFICKTALINKKSERAWLYSAILCYSCALLAIHIFSPYLNHPIGLGFLLFAVPFLTFKEKNNIHGSKVEILKMPIKQISFDAPAQFSQQTKTQ